ncbi:predicted protein [Naegleria gruberi]|uniref:Predicted protein n=1 Tax=Naegleria gruberi TaxID=5762 RepID=D2W1V6_NAEGR|nr:uncharacterized protein NAEGRDRAFT_75284 [Naegleria gruberi]EFC36983.1 predicted protein [Naegleria gruberi]|eukprot:XP_002669727.1 predicted protein [Naegleria gruberi strain NEG-M]
MIQLLRFCALLVVFLLLANITLTLHQTTGGLRDYLASLQKERDAVACTKTKLENTINLLNSTFFTSNSSSAPSLKTIIDLRSKQLSKVASAIALLDAEIRVINSQCSTYNGSDCNACQDGFTNYPNCVPVCFGLAANNASVCSGHGSCIAPNNCTCTKPYIGASCSSFFTAPMTPYLAHAYYFNNTFADSVGSLHLVNNPNQGASSNPVFSNDSPFPGGKSVYFDGKKNGLASTVNVNLTVSNSFSLWLKSPYGGVAMAFSTNGNYIFFNVASAKGFSFYDDKFTTPFVTDGTLFATDVWRHLVFVFRTDGTDLYIDGSLYKTSATSIASKNLSDGKLTIGGHNAGTYYYTGYIANVMIFTKALTAPEVSSLTVNNYF